MAVKTGHEDSVKERGELGDLHASAMILIRGNKRSESQRAALRKALQLFLENRLGMVLPGNVDKTPGNLHMLLSLPLSEIMERKCATWCKNFGVKYLGELYLLPDTHVWHTSKRREAEGVRLALGAIGMPPTLDIVASGWIPPYANDPKVQEAWQMRLHMLGNFNHFMLRRDPERRVCNAHDGCLTVGEYLRNPPHTLRRWRLSVVLNELDKHGLHLRMYVPPTWTPVVRDPEGCMTYNRFEWEGLWLESHYKAKLESHNVTTLESFTKKTRAFYVEAFGKHFIEMVEPLMVERGLAFEPEPPVGEGPPIPIEECEFSVRLYNCLKHAGINTLQEAVAKGEAELLRTPNMGRKPLNELKEVMAGYRLSFATK